MTDGDRGPVVEIPELFGKLRSRFRIRTGGGGKASLSTSILPVTQIDPLALVTRGVSRSDTITGNEINVVATVPVGEFWHLKKAAVLSAAAGTFDTQLVIRAKFDYLDLTGTKDIPVTPYLVADGSYYIVDLVGVILRPGDDIRVLTTNHSVDGTTLVSVLFDLEDCAS